MPGASSPAAELPLGTNYEITSREIDLSPLPHSPQAAHKNPLHWLPNLSEITFAERLAAEELRSRQLARLGRWAMLRAAGDLLPLERVSHCLRHPVIRKGEKMPETVDVYRAAELADARFSGLSVCGSVWTCPVCAQSIAAQRAKELRACGRAHLAAGGGAIMVALTFSHHQGDNLQQMLKDFGAARERMCRQRAYRTLLAEFGIFGNIRALEVTVGSNGWHPHTHDLFFIPAPLEALGAPVERLVMMGGDAVLIRSRQHAPLHVFTARLYRLWKLAAKHFGLTVSKDGVHARATQAGATQEEWDDTTGYMQDRHEVDFGGGWDAASELTRGSHKQARKGGSTPMQLLADFAIEEDHKAGHQFQQYAAAFHGRAQLMWSPGLKARLMPGTEVVSDQDAAEAMPAEYLRWASLSLSDFKRVLRSEARGELLNAASLDDLVLFDRIVSDCAAGTRVARAGRRSRREAFIAAAVVPGGHPLALLGAPVE